MAQISYASAFFLVLCATSSRGDDKALGPLMIDAAFPGGNIVVDKVERDVVFVHHDLRDTRGPWFYWCFRVRGAAGRTLSFRFTRGPVLGLQGPAVSTDAGQTWSWLGRSAQDDRFSYTFAANAAEVRFSFGIPYLQANLDRFLRLHKGNNALRKETLCRTVNGRSAEAIFLGRLGGKANHRILLTCRHHACEAMANYGLEGLLSVVLANTESGRWFREHVEILAIPFMDKDGVEDGDQGKNREPYDHWLDYAGTSRYPTVAALRKRVAGWAGGRLRVAFDLHCPARLDDRIYLAGPSNPRIAERIVRFSRILESGQSGPLVFHFEDNMPFGKGWNTAATYGQHKSFALWAEDYPGVLLAATVELPYAGVRGKTVTPDGARAFGAGLAAALRRFLEEQR